MSFEIVELPLKEAIELEAKQNRERDVRVLGADEASNYSIYHEEAEHLLTTSGEGYEPEFPDHKLVKVKKS